MNAAFDMGRRGLQLGAALCAIAFTMFAHAPLEAQTPPPPSNYEADEEPSPPHPAVLEVHEGELPTHSHADIDSGAVHLVSAGEALEIRGYETLGYELEIDVVRYRARQVRSAHWRLCETPCRLVLRAPLQVRVGGIDFEIDPESQRQTYQVTARRPTLHALARAAAALGGLGALVSVVFWRKGVFDRVGGDDAFFRGGIAGMVLGGGLLIAGIIAARRWRGIARRL